MCLLILSSWIYSAKAQKDTAEIQEGTTLLVSERDVETHNHILADLNACTEVADSMNQANIILSLTIEGDNQVIESQRNDIQTMEQSIGECEKRSAIYENEAKRGRFRTRILKLGLSIVTAVAIVEAGVIYLVSK